MKLLQILIIALLIIPASLAADELEPISTVSIDKSVEWVVTQPKSETEEAALSVLAATKSDVVSNQDALDDLIPLRSSSKYCWPSSGCTIKNTALALLALGRAGSTVSFDWMDDREEVNTQGDWLLQIDSQAKGTCNINYDGEQTTVEVEASRIKSPICPQSTQFNLDNCLEPNLLSDKTFLDITVQCGALGAGKISLIYKVNDQIYLMGEVSNNVYSILKIKNGHFNDYQATLYTAWAYISLNKDVNSIAWLRRFYTPTIENSALMYIITEQDNYLKDLLEFQNSDTGNFGSVYDTALATLALRKQGLHTLEIELAKSWLEARMLDDGSWNNDVSDTAMVIYGAFAPLDVEITPSTTIQPDPEQTECNGNGFCETFLSETPTNCPSDCYCGDGVCDSSEDEFSCLEDCPIIDTDQDFDEDIVLEEDEGSSFLFWLFILILLLVIGGLGYFYYKNYYLTGKNLFKPKQPALFKQPTYRPQQPRQAYQPTYRPQPAKKSLIEKQLEESLKEAKKILGKK